MARKQLPAKPVGDAAVEPLRTKGLTKGKTAPAIRRGERRKVKPRVDAKTKRAAEIPPPVEAGGWPELGDQRSVRSARSSQRYVRLQIRLEDGQLAIVGSHIVDGPLAQSSAFEGNYAYEVTDGTRLVHAGSIPDFGVFRGFAHPNGTREQRRHHTYQPPVNDFHARVPLNALNKNTLPKINVVLYRVKEHPPLRAPLALALAETATIGVQRDRELREVARVVGVPSWVLESGRTAVPPAGDRARTSRGARKRKRAGARAQGNQDV
jgi:hypothetical protein